MFLCKNKTAFVLSGGGSRGAYQVGVWQALAELGIDPDIVVGVSIGAVNGAMVMQGDVIRTANLWRTMETDMIFDVDEDADFHDFAKEFVTNKGAGSSGMQSILKEYINEDYIRNSPKDFGFITVEVPQMKPHYLWKEDVPYGRLCDFIGAGASAFPAVQTYEIDGKKYIDGGYEDNLPINMARERGADHIIAVNLDAIGKIHSEEIEPSPDLTLIESSWNLGDFLIFNVENTKRIMRLGYLDTMKTFQIYEGKYYSFVKGTFNSKELLNADLAAKYLDLDPLILYRHDFFMDKLRTAVSEAKSDASEVIDRVEEKLDSISIGKEHLRKAAGRINREFRKIVKLGKTHSLNELDAIKELKELRKLVNKKTALLIIARNIKTKGSDSIFLNRHTIKLFGDEIAAANFLVKNNLI